MTATDAQNSRVSVVIPSWNGYALLAECLDSLAAQTWRDFETVVVDDASTDDTSTRTPAEYPWVRLVRHETNRGFCGAVNTGIGEARGELIILLNNDMTLDPAFLQALVEAADAHTSVAMFAPLILWKDEPDTIYAAGDLQRANGRAESIGFRAPLAGFTFRDEVFGVSAGAALYRRELFDRIGVFDERYGVYFSDSDLSFRARLAGHGARFVRDAVTYHVGSASLFGKTLRRTCQCYVNHALLVVKNMPFPLLVRHLPELLAERLHQTRRVFSAARAESGAVFALRTLIKAWLESLRLLPHALTARRAIQRARTISLAALEALLSP